MKGVIVFVKNPEIGKVKTRLAATLGDKKALEIYHKLTGYTRDLLIDAEVDKKYVFYSSFVDQEDDWSSEVFAKQLQVNGGLGDKIKAAVSKVFEECNQVVIIGSDCPQLKSSHIEDAFRRMDSHNVVIGPSLDGGYYLLGMDNYYPELFEGINWSTETVCDETLAKAEQLKLKSTRLESLSDVDYEEDWVKYGF